MVKVKLVALLVTAIWVVGCSEDQPVSAKPENSYGVVLIKTFSGDSQREGKPNYWSPSAVGSTAPLTEIGFEHHLQLIYGDGGVAEIENFQIQVAYMRLNPSNADAWTYNGLPAENCPPLGTINGKFITNDVFKDTSSLNLKTDKRGRVRLRYGIRARSGVLPGHLTAYVLWGARVRQVNEVGGSVCGWKAELTNPYDPAGIEAFWHMSYLAQGPYINFQASLFPTSANHCPGWNWCPCQGPGSSPAPEIEGLITTTGCQCWGDFDNDGDVDLSDFIVLQTCFNGPDRPYPELLGYAICSPTDADQDGDVDLDDFSNLQLVFNGPNRPPALCR